MSLNKTLIPVPFTGGVDTKTAEKLVQNGFFLDLQNVVRRNAGALQKRYGFTQKGKTIFGSSSLLEAGERLSTFRDDLLMLDGSKIYSYSPARDSWSDRGQVVSASVESTPVIRNSVKQAMPDMATLSGITVTVWEDSRGGIRCTVTDDSTGAPLLADSSVSATGVRPKVVAFNATFLIAYIDGTSLKCRRIAITDPTTLLTEQTIEASSSDNPFDLAVYGTVAMFAHNTGTAVRLGYVTSAGAVGSPGTNGWPDPVNFTERGRNAVNLVIDSTAGVAYTFYHDAGGASLDIVRCRTYTIDLNTTAVASVESVASVRNITATLRSTTGLRVFYEISAASVKNHRVRTNTVTYAPNSITVGTAASFLRSVGLASKAFTVDTNEYVTVVHESTLQSTYFTAKQDGFIVARMQPSLASGLSRDSAGTLKSGIPNVNADSNDAYVFPVCVKNRLLTETSSTQSSFVGVNKQALSFGDATFNTDTIGENFCIAGGLMLTYDGVSTVEHGFHVYPEDHTGAATANAGSLSAGDYQIVLVYEWVDGQGQVHQSAGSVPLAVTATASKTIDVTAPTLRLTQKTGTRAEVRIVAYRSKVGLSSVLYRDTDVANVTTSDTVTITLTQADTTLATGQILYTIGGELDNIAAPACTAAHKHKNRMFLFGLEDQYAVAYSKTQVYGEGAGFSDGLVIRVDPRGGPVRCGSTLDDKLIIFKDTALFFQVGDGPLPTGAQNDYQDPQLISSDVGCNNPRSVVIMPKGVMFQATNGKGIYLLGRGLETLYIGSGVDAFNDLTVTSATLIETDSEVRFTTETGVCLVYNYLFDQWSTFSNYDAMDACNFLGTYTHLKSDGTVNSEVVGQYNDNGQTYSQRIETNWFNLGRVQGMQRIYKWALLGDFVSHCVARVSVAFDYEDTYNEIAYFRTQTGLGTDTYGSDATYGSASVYGGSGSTVFQCRSKPRRQKCESIKLLIEDLDTITTAGGGSFNLVSLVFEVGQKQGIYRNSAAKAIGG